MGRANSLQSRVRRLLSEGRSKKEVRQTLLIDGFSPKTLKAYISAETVAAAPDDGWISDAKRAAALHLLDLKRAGHSPRLTEYRISPERATPIYRSALNHSCCGSPAALAVEYGG